MLDKLVEECGDSAKASRVDARFTKRAEIRPAVVEREKKLEPRCVAKEKKKERKTYIGNMRAAWL